MCLSASLLRELLIITLILQVIAAQTATGLADENASDRADDIANGVLGSAKRQVTGRIETCLYRPTSRPTG